MDAHNTTCATWPVYVDNARRHISVRSQIENRTKQGFLTPREDPLVFKTSAFNEEPERDEEEDQGQAN